MQPAADPIYTLHHPAEVLAIVERMQRERAMTTIEFADGHAIVSNLLEVRRHTNALVFDIPRDAEQNHRLFASRTLAFVSELDHVRITFETGAASPLTLTDGPAAVVDLPTAVVRLQRREWFRALLPVQPPIRCTVLDQDGHAIDARAIDLSLGGTGLAVDERSAAQVQPGSGHELILSLPEIGRLELEATLQTVMPTAPSKVRMGFRFESVPTKTASQIQRYVQQLQVAQLRLVKTRG